MYLFLVVNMMQQKTHEYVLYVFSLHVFGVLLLILHLFRNMCLCKYNCLIVYKITASINVIEK